VVGGGGPPLAGSLPFVWGATYGPFIAEGEWWRLITGGFLHSGLPHLLFNMLALWVLGQLLEPRLGSLRFGVIYFVSLLAGSFGALLLAPTQPTVGASGAVFGLMAAAFVVLRTEGINPMQNGLAFWLGLNLLFTFLVPGISIGGHLGGLAGGMLAGLAVYFVGERMRNPALGIALAVGIGALAVVGSIAIAGSLTAAV
jgi:membrane associated rhomboid family serine protease